MRGGSEMNYKTYRYNGLEWSTVGPTPLHPALSKKLYDQNMQQYTQHKKPGVWWMMPLNTIKVKVNIIDKYTIVELTHNNKHYHGLTSLADCDKENVVTGIAVAYHRAFEKMVQHPRTNVEDESPIKKSAVDDAIDFFNKHQESKAHFHKCLLGTFGVTYKEVGLKEDDDLSPVGKAYFKNKDWVSYDLPCGKLNEIFDKKSKHVEKAISDLLACTYIDLKQYDLKTVYGAKAAIKEISKYGYKVYELHNINPLISTYVLQRFGKEITRRDIEIQLTHKDKQK